MNPKDTNIVKCPKCKWANEVMKGDKLHPHVSTKKPKESDVYEDIVSMSNICRNPNCKNKFPVYYYRGKLAFRFG